MRSIEQLLQDAYDKIEETVGTGFFNSDAHVFLILAWKECEASHDRSLLPVIDKIDEALEHYNEDQFESSDPVRFDIARNDALHAIEQALRQMPVTAGGDR